MQQAASGGVKEQFYAVQKGRHPGIYSSWAECSPEIDGYSGATSQKFSTREEAEMFVAGKAPLKRAIPSGPTVQVLPARKAGRPKQQLMSELKRLEILIKPSATKPMVTTVLAGAQQGPMADRKKSAPRNAASDCVAPIRLVRGDERDQESAPEDVAAAGSAAIEDSLPVSADQDWRIDSDPHLELPDQDDSAGPAQSSAAPSEPNKGLTIDLTSDARGAADSALQPVAESPASAPAPPPPKAKGRPASPPKRGARSPPKSRSPDASRKLRRASSPELQSQSKPPSLAPAPALKAKPSVAQRAPAPVALTPLGKPRPRPAAPKPQETVKRLEIYADGSCLGNGRQRPVGGIGVYFGENDPRNLSERLDDSEKPATNNRAEITAVIRALQVVEADPSLSPTHPITIFSDSQYTINAINRWLPGWRKTNYKKGQIKNIDLWERFCEVASTIKRHVKWEYVPGHSGYPGNEAADRLANAAYQLPPLKPAAAESEAEAAPLELDDIDVEEYPDA